MQRRSRYRASSRADARRGRRRTQPGPGAAVRPPPRQDGRGADAVLTGRWGERAVWCAAGCAPSRAPSRVTQSGDPVAHPLDGLMVAARQKNRRAERPRGGEGARATPASRRGGGRPSGAARGKGQVAREDGRGLSGAARRGEAGHGQVTSRRATFAARLGAPGRRRRGHAATRGGLCARSLRARDAVPGGVGHGPRRGPRIVLAPDAPTGRWAMRWTRGRQNCSASVLSCMARVEARPPEMVWDTASK